MMNHKMIFVLAVVTLACFPKISFALDRINWKVDLSDEQRTMLSAYQSLWNGYTKKKQNDLRYKADLLISLKEFSTQDEEIFQQKWSELSEQDQRYVREIIKYSKRYKKRNRSRVNFGRLRSYSNGDAFRPDTPVARTPENAKK